MSILVGETAGDAGIPCPQGSSRSPWPRRGATLICLAIVAQCSHLACRRASVPAATGPLPVIAQVPDFTLTERSGRPLGRADLLGKVWTANFLFTNCSGPCPTLSLRMRSVEQSVLADPSLADVRMVSFTLDPANDTVEVLRAYADKYEADPQRWWFVTGADERAMHELVKKGFLQAVARATADGTIVHSTYFVLVDRVGRIRAVHDGLAPESKPLILRDLRRLIDEPTNGS